jgi:hypothetical protein
MDLRNDAVKLFYSPKDVYDRDLEKYTTQSLVGHLQVFIFDFSIVLLCFMFVLCCCVMLLCYVVMLCYVTL